MHLDWSTDPTRTTPATGRIATGSSAKCRVATARTRAIRSRWDDGVAFRVVATRVDGATDRVAGHTRGEPAFSPPQALVGCPEGEGIASHRLKIP